MVTFTPSGWRVTIKRSFSFPCMLVVVWYSKRRSYLFFERIRVIIFSFVCEAFSVLCAARDTSWAYFSYPFEASIPSFPLKYSIKRYKKLRIKASHTSLFKSSIWISLAAHTALFKKRKDNKKICCEKIREVCAATDNGCAYNQPLPNFFFKLRCLCFCKQGHQWQSWYLFFFCFYVEGIQASKIKELLSFLLYAKLLS